MPTYVLFQLLDPQLTFFSGSMLHPFCMVQTYVRVLESYIPGIFNMFGLQSKDSNLVMEFSSALLKMLQSL